jgi:oxygen-independent coproporphyrinogen-3 oxidase
VSYGLYLHVPFCQQHCHYCAFPISLAGEGRHAPYVDRLLRELDLAEIPGEPDTVYLGGGTPSLLSPELIARLLEGVGRPGGGTGKSPPREVSIEVNPGTLDPERLDVYRDLGVNRVSLGAQSFDGIDLDEMGRLHSPAQIVKDFERLRDAGFDNVSIDLIAGLPGQDASAWSANLEWVERLGPDHVSIYMLELDEGSAWKRTAPARGAEEAAADLYAMAQDRLGGMGYRHYEISNWARPGRECRHNLGYWTHRPYRGLGLGAHSFIDEKRFGNTRSMSEYAKLIDQGVLPVETVEASTPSTRIREAFLLGLRRLDGFDVFDVSRQLGFSYPASWFDRLEALRASGRVEFDGVVLRLAPAGCLVAGAVTEELLCPDLLSICEAIR